MAMAQWTFKARVAVWVVSILIIPTLTPPAFAQFPLEVNGMFKFFGGAAVLEDARSNEFFTDCFGQTTPVCQGTGGSINNGTVGWSVGVGLDLPVWGLPWGDLLVTEINLQFARFSSSSTFFQLIEDGPVTGGPTPCGGARCPVGTKPGFTEGQREDPDIGLRRVRTTTFQVSFSPKYRWDTFVKDRSIRPWLIPAGFETSVNSPPPRNINLWDVGGVTGLGVEVHVWERIWVGIEGRYHYRMGITDVDTNHFTTGGYVGISF